MSGHSYEIECPNCNNKEAMFFNKDDDEKTYNNFRNKFNNMLLNTPTFDSSRMGFLSLEYEKVLRFLNTNLNFMVIDQPILMLQRFVDEGSFGIPSMELKNKMIETITIECDSYINVYNHIKSLMELDENKDKSLMVYEISIFSANFFDFGYTHSYKTRIRYAIEDLGVYDHLLKNYNIRKKRKEIAEYYNPKNAMTFKEYVIKEQKKIRDITDKQIEKNRSRVSRYGNTPEVFKDMSNMNMLWE